MRQLAVILASLSISCMSFSSSVLAETIAIIGTGGRHRRTRGTLGRRRINFYLPPIRSTKSARSQIELKVMAEQPMLIERGPPGRA